MSLPIPSVGRPANSDTHGRAQKMNLNMAMDAPLVALAQQCNGDLRLLLHSFFSFLHRRTDFYCIRHPNDETSKTEPSSSAKVNATMGFKDGDAEKLLIAAFRQFPLRRMPSMEEIAKRKEQDELAKEKKEKAEKDSSQNPQGTSSQTVSDDIADDAVRTIISSPSKSQALATKAEIRYTDEGKQIPVGNGGSSSTNFKYKWTQTLHEITVAMTLPSPQTRAKELSVEIQTSSILIKYWPTNTILLRGAFPSMIDKDESTWSIESNVILLQLEKKAKDWWDKALVDENDEIDLDLVDKTHKISSYDEVTQGMIRKLLFDERQERLGLPNSDDILQKSNTNSFAKPNDAVNLGDSNDSNSTNIIRNVEELKKIPGVEFIDKHNFPK